MLCVLVNYLQRRINHRFGHQANKQMIVGPNTHPQTGMYSACTILQIGYKSRLRHRPVEPSSYVPPDYTKQICTPLTRPYTTGSTRTERKINRVQR